jgi:hypothetical protein
MAGNGGAYLVIAPYPVGQNTDQRDQVLEGYVMPYNASAPDPVDLITGFSITSDVVTFDVANSFTTGGGDSIYVTGFKGALSYLNGIYTTNSATSSTVLAPITHANVAQTVANGLVTLTPQYTTGGLPINGFLNTQGQPVVPALIGPLNTPHWMQVVSGDGGSLTYGVNLQTTPPSIIISGQTAGSALTAADLALFRAEYTKNAF